MSCFVCLLVDADLYSARVHKITTASARRPLEKPSGGEGIIDCVKQGCTHECDTHSGRGWVSRAL